MSSDKLSDNLWPGDINLKTKGSTPEKRVEEALQKALDSTTPERPGTPWDKQEKGDNEQRYWCLPEGH